MSKIVFHDGEIQHLNTSDKINDYSIDCIYESAKALEYKGVMNTLYSNVYYVIVVAKLFEFLAD